MVMADDVVSVVGEAVKWREVRCAKEEERLLSDRTRRKLQAPTVWKERATVYLRTMALLPKQSTGRNAQPSSNSPSYDTM